MNLLSITVGKLPIQLWLAAQAQFRIIPLMAYTFVVNTFPFLFENKSIALAYEYCRNFDDSNRARAMGISIGRSVKYEAKYFLRRNTNFE